MTEDLTLVLLAPHLEDGCVLLPASAVSVIRESTDNNGEPFHVEDAMLDYRNEDLTYALLEAGLARVEEPLGHHEVLVIPAEGRTQVVALALELGYTVSGD